jgi:Uma2 family endonuclease
VSTTERQPVWAIAARFPLQGDWGEAEYLSLPEGYPRAELSAGRIELLPMPTDRHQAILTAILLLLVEYAKRTGGKARPAGIRLRLQEGRFREPDVAFLSQQRLHLRGLEYWTGADLVVEIVGGADDRARDYVVKRDDYARAGIPEYWIVDPDQESILVLTFQAGKYVEAGSFTRGATITSPSFPGLQMSATTILEAD